MKIIFSRKGFDSGEKSGGVANPILPSGALCPLPIPERAENEYARSYAEIRAAGQSMGDLVEQLTRKRISRTLLAHLDPDLDVASIPRPDGWKPLFGQAGAAESHLQNQGVAPGDLFLFFGWFRQVEAVSGLYRYVPGSPDQHVIFGWLQVEKRIAASERAQLPAWAFGHPHAKAVPYGKKDSVYLSTDELCLAATHPGLPGAGLFGTFDQKLCLTASGKTRSIWQLPAWFNPGGHTTPLTYHSDHSRWSRTENATLLRSVPIGQEFVLDCVDYPEALEWVADTFTTLLTGAS
jgi:hypothetical protein